VGFQGVGRDPGIVAPHFAQQHVAPDHALAGEIEIFDDKDQKIGELLESNRNLAADSASCNEALKNTEEKAELYENELEEKEECRDDLLSVSERLEGIGLFKTLFVILLIVNAIVCFLLFMHFSSKKHLEGID